MKKKIGVVAAIGASAMALTGCQATTKKLRWKYNNNARTWPETGRDHLER